MSVARLLNPASIAIVGASDKVGPGLNAWRALQYVGYTGRVYLVNPRKASLLGQPTYPSLAEIPGSVDAAFIAVPRDAVLDSVRAAAGKGAGGVAVLSSGFGEAGAAGVTAERELAAIARGSDMAVCGPNCLGFLNFAGATALFGTSLPDTVARGGVAVVAQSGSIGIALLNCARGFGFSHLITSGNEAVTTAADYLDALIDDAAVTTVIAFLEQLRQPERFVEVARRAYALGKPVIVVKSGRTERGRHAVMAHTGAVAGSDEVCEAAFRTANVIRVATLDELIETAVLVSSMTARPAAPGVAMLSVSGGEIALALDIADAAGLALPPVPGAQAAVAGLLPDFAHATNPLDLTWAGTYDPTIAQRCVEALGRSVRAAIFLNGSRDSSDLLRRVAGRADLVVAADGGARYALEAGIVPDLVVGDMDSLGEDLAREVEKRGASLERHPVRKDKMDGQLAVLAVRERGATAADLLCAVGGRLGALFAVPHILLAAERIGLRSTVVADRGRMFVIEAGSRTVRGDPQDSVSIFSLSGPAAGVTLEGMEYPLENASLEPGDTLGFHNELIGREATVSVEEGALLIVHETEVPVTGYTDSPAVTF